MEFDTVIHGGTLVTASETSKGDIGIRNGRIVALAESLPGGERRIDAGGRLVMPGGIDEQCWRFKGWHRHCMRPHSLRGQPKGDK